MQCGLPKRRAGFGEVSGGGAGHVSTPDSYDDYQRPQPSGPHRAETGVHKLRGGGLCPGSASALCREIGEVGSPRHNAQANPLFQVFSDSRALETTGRTPMRVQE